MTDNEVYLKNNVKCILVTAKNTFEASVGPGKCSANRQTVGPTAEMSHLPSARQNGSRECLPLLDKGGKKDIVSSVLEETYTEES